MKNQLLEKKLKLLKVRASSLKSELNLVKGMFQSACTECSTIYSERAHGPKDKIESKEIENTPHPELNINPEQEVEIEIEKSDPEVKGLFRKIALKVHPDKLVSLTPGKEKEDKAKLYQRATTAAEHSDLLELLLIAEELGIEDNVPSVDKLNLLEKYIIDVKKEINHVQSTVMWQWFFCEDETQKEKLLQKLFEHLYE